MAATTARPSPALREVLSDPSAPPFVPNSLFLSDFRTLLVVSGPNMSGKTTFLKSVAVLAVLAHAGSFVPANFASFRVLDRVFTRMLDEEQVGGSGGGSAFRREMRDVAFAARACTASSLVCIDELGRATSTRDALAVAWSVCEARSNAAASPLRSLLPPRSRPQPQGCSAAAASPSDPSPPAFPQHMLAAGAFTLCATHIPELSTLPDVYPAAKAVHFRAEARPAAAAAGTAAEQRRGAGLEFLFELAGAHRTALDAPAPPSGLP